MKRKQQIPKTVWSTLEIIQLHNLYLEYGNRWGSYCCHYQDRSEQSIKSKFNTLVKQAKLINDKPIKLDKHIKQQEQYKYLNLFSEFEIAQHGGSREINREIHNQKQRKKIQKEESTPSSSQTADWCLILNNLIKTETH